jgi:hypothetical protein
MNRFELLVPSLYMGRLVDGFGGSHERRARLLSHRHVGIRVEFSDQNSDVELMTTCKLWSCVVG